MSVLAVEGRDLASGPPTTWTVGRGVAWTLVGNVTYALCQWAVLVVLARAGDAEMVGRFALALAVTAPVLLGANLQLREILATDARRDHMFADYLRVRLFTTGLALVAVAGITWLAGYRQETAVVVLLVAVAKGSEAVADLCHGLLQREERMDQVAYSMMLRGSLSVLAVGIGVLATGRLAWGLVGLALSWTLVLVGYDLRAVTAGRAGERAGRRGPAPAPLARLRGLVRGGLPLGIVAMLMSLGVNVPRYFIERFSGERELGIFAALAYLMVAATTVASAVDRAISPRLARQYVDGRVDAVRGLLWRATAVCAACGGAGIVLALLGGRPALALLYGHEYAEHATLLVWVMVAAALSSLNWPLNAALVAFRKLYPQVVVSALNLVGLTALSWLLVPRHGLAGAVVAMVLSAAALVVVRGVLIERHLRVAAGGLSGATR